MLAMPGLRVFSLAAKQGSEGISCDVDGVFVGGIPILQPPGAGNALWRVRPLVELNKELTGRYRLPINVAAKASGFALIAAAFNRGDVAMAAFGRADANSRSAAARANARKAEARLRVALENSFAAACSNFSGTLPSIRVPVCRQIQAGTAPKPPVPINAQPSLPFPDGLPPQLAPYVPGEKTSGILYTPGGSPIPLQSGYAGPAAAMQGTAGYDRYTLSHVEGHAAALMRQEGITEGTLYINNRKICSSCQRLLPTMLAPGTTLNVVLPDNTIVQFTGIGP